MSAEWRAWHANKRTQGLVAYVGLYNPPSSAASTEIVRHVYDMTEADIDTLIALYKLTIATGADRP